VGLVFGALYIGFPTLTGALLDRPITILPLPFVDFTQQTAHYLPATPVAVAFDLGMFLIGMVLPFWAMLGTFGGFLATVVFNPVLASPAMGVLRSWNPGDNMQTTFYKNQIDFYFSFALVWGSQLPSRGCFRWLTHFARTAKERGAMALVRSWRSTSRRAEAISDRS